MTSLTTAPLAPLIARLFADAESASAALNRRFAEATSVDQNALMTRVRSKTDYADFYRDMKDQPLAVSRDTATLLYMLARSCRAATIVEFGTSFGISTLHLAAALRDNGGGRIVTSEFEASKAQRAQANLDAAGLSDLVEIRVGDALDTLARDLPDAIDLVLLDGAKGVYADILDLLEPRLRPGALIVADNADWCRDYLARVRSAEHGYMSVPFAEDVELSIRIG